MPNAAHVAVLRLPPLAGRVVGVLPLEPLRLVVGQMLARIARRHAGMFVRMGNAATKTFLIDTTDLPFVFVLRPDPRRPAIAVLRRARLPSVDARIAAPLAVLLGLVQGTYDGDALFFSRDLMIEGDVEAVLALRNAIDNAELDLRAELADMLGPLWPPTAAISQNMMPLIRWIAHAFPPRAAGHGEPWRST